MQRVYLGGRQHHDCHGGKSAGRCVNTCAKVIGLLRNQRNVLQPSFYICCVSHAKLLAEVLGKVADCTVPTCATSITLTARTFNGLLKACRSVKGICCLNLWWRVVTPAAPRLARLSVLVNVLAILLADTAAATGFQPHV